MNPVNVILIGIGILVLLVVGGALFEPEPKPFVTPRPLLPMETPAESPLPLEHGGPEP